MAMDSELVKINLRGVCWMNLEGRWEQESWICHGGQDVLDWDVAAARNLLQPL